MTRGVDQVRYHDNELGHLLDKLKPWDLFQSTHILDWLVVWK